LDWVATLSLLQGWLDQWGAIVSRLSAELSMGLILPSVLLSILSRRWDVIAGSAILALSAFLVVISPPNVVSIISAGLYIGSLLLAVSALFGRRRARHLEGELAELRAQVNALSTSEHRRLLRDIRSSSRDAGPASQTGKK
jgi:hypothetical protein